MRPAYPKFRKPLFLAHGLPAAIFYLITRVNFTMTTALYISRINECHKLGNATEHTFRGDLQQLLVTLSETARLMRQMDKDNCS